MPTIRIPIVENRHKSQTKLFDKLPDAAKQLFVAIAKSGRDLSLNDIRNMGAFGSTSDIEQLLYALESRGFGEVKVNGAEVYFIANKTLIQSVL
jgi:hypothetical protein